MNLIHKISNMRLFNQIFTRKLTRCAIADHSHHWSTRSGFEIPYRASRAFHHFIILSIFLSFSFFAFFCSLNGTLVRAFPHVSWSDRNNLHLSDLYTYHLVAPWTKIYLMVPFPSLHSLRFSEDMIRPLPQWNDSPFSCFPTGPLPPGPIPIPHTAIGPKLREWYSAHNAFVCTRTTAIIVVGSKIY